MSNESSDLIKNPYDLLQSYGKWAKVLSKAYSHSDSYYRKMSKAISYPLVILTSVASVISIIPDESVMLKYMMTGLNLSMLILIGFQTTIKPMKQALESRQMSVEFGEIASNVKQYINSNHRTHDEIRDYSSIIHDNINTWISLSPPIKTKYIKHAQTECTSRHRKHSVGQKKKDSIV